MLDPQTYMNKILQEQIKISQQKRDSCIETYGKSVLSNATKYIIDNTTNTRKCPAFWDDILCWPPTETNTTANLSCKLASHVAGFNKIDNYATRYCTPNASWYIHEEENTYWADYRNCFTGPTTMVFISANETASSKANLAKEYVHILKIISTAGYTVSLITLIMAFFIMLLIKKLHCARNMIHLHLFASFILRAFIFLLRDAIFEDGVGLSSDFIQQNDSIYFKVDPVTKNWECKFLTTLWQYFITANYSWILMEGFYLHNLIFKALLASSGKSVIWYIIMGWGLPLLVIVPWVIMRLLQEDILCWTLNEKYEVFLILLIPISTSIFINVFFFARISIILFSKLRSPLNEASRRYKKWAKSTLVLMPLFGINYAIFLSLYYSTNEVVRLIWLLCDGLFGSIQGFLVAILYCFLNGEVKSELKPYVHNILNWLANNKPFGYCFPCKKTYLRSSVGRTSVCTTMSCSSLHANGLHSRLKGSSHWDVCHSNKTACTDRCKEYHTCDNGLKQLHDSNCERNPNYQRKSSRNGFSFNRYSQPIDVHNEAETTSFSNLQRQDGHMSDPHILEEHRSMLLTEF